MVLWLKSLFAWKVVFDTGAFCFWENAVTGERAITRYSTGADQTFKR